jgi:hypothetical protein
MKKHLVALIFLLVIGSLPTAAVADVGDGERFWVPGFTVGTRTGMMPRAGVDLSLMTRKGQGDGIVGYGPIAGISGLSPFEYYVGGAYGGAYMIAMWGEVTVNFVGAEPTGVRALGAIGFIVMPYVAVGYDKRAQVGAFIEAGLTTKIPLLK